MTYSRYDASTDTHFVFGGSDQLHGSASGGADMRLGALALACVASLAIAGAILLKPPADSDCNVCKAVTALRRAVESQDRDAYYAAASVLAKAGVLKAARVSDLIGALSVEVELGKRWPEEWYPHALPLWIASGGDVRAILTALRPIMDVARWLGVSNGPDETRDSERQASPLPPLGGEAVRELVLMLSDPSSDARFRAGFLLSMLRSEEVAWAIPELLVASRDGDSHVARQARSIVVSLGLRAEAALRAALDTGRSVAEQLAALWIVHDLGAGGMPLKDAVQGRMVESDPQVNLAAALCLLAWDGGDELAIAMIRRLLLVPDVVLLERAISAARRVTSPLTPLIGDLERLAEDATLPSYLRADAANAALALSK